MDLLTIQQNSGHRCKTTTLRYMRLKIYAMVKDLTAKKEVSDVIKKYHYIIIL